MRDLGQFALILALFLSSYAILADIIGAWRRDKGLLKSGRNAMAAYFLCLSVSMAVLWVLLIKCDFSVKYVVEHTSRDLPLAYRISALWAGAGGSLLLWLWLQVGMLFVVFFTTRLPRQIFCAHARVISNLVSVFFLLVLVLDKSPFEVSEVIPADGAGLNPLLQHPAMVLHPPILFVGYAAFAVPFAWAFACLKTSGQIQKPDLIGAARNWTLAAWLFLTAGIVLGAWWAYEELGWGGYWAWDPVENSSLMPWLTATALVHCFRIFAPRTRIVIWTELLSLLTFSLCIFGTFLTRYGLVSSVHAFPEPGLGILFIVLLIHIWVLAGILVVMRFCIRKEAADFSRPPAQRFFVWNNWLFLFLTFVILIGTLFPFLSGLVSERKITLKPEYFNKITTPGGLVLLLFIAVCPYLWRHGLKMSWRLIIASVVSVLAIVWLIAQGLAARLTGEVPPQWVVQQPVAMWFTEKVVPILLAAKTTPPILIAFSTFIVATLIGDVAIGANLRKKRTTSWYGSRIVHLGVALIFIGIAGSGGYDIERQMPMIPGQQEKVGEYDVVYESLGVDHGPNFTAMWAAMSVYHNDQMIVQLKPARAVYSAGGKPISEVDIRRTLGSDLYMALMDVDTSSKLINLRVMVKPLINWIWIGSVLMVLGAGMIVLGLAASRK